MSQALLKELIQTSEELKNASVKNFEAISVGCNNQCWKLDLEDNRKFFIKITSIQDFGRLQFETKSLSTLRNFADSTILKIPEPLNLIKIKDVSLLLFPWLQLNNGNQKNLGKGLALLHQLSSLNNPNKFGWATNGYIGAGPQNGGWESNWGDFFIEKRLKPQIIIAKKWGLIYEQWADSLIEITSYLNHHNPSPSIVHGDLWSGNAATLPDGRGVLIDPAISWSDREVDIAMSKLFGGFSLEFYKEYENIWPLNTQAKERIDIYNLYHLLNHANLFGGTYKEQSLSILKKLKKKFS